MKKILLFGAAALIAASASAAEVVLAETDFTTASAYQFWAQGVEPKVENGALSVSNDEVRPEFYNVQYIVVDNVTLVGGTEYTIDVKIKGFSGELHYNFGTWSSNVNGGTQVEEANDWQNVVFKATAKEDTDGTAHLLLQSGDFVGTYYVASVKITYNEEGQGGGDDPVEPSTGWTSIITNGNANDGASANVLARIDGKDVEAEVVANPAGEGKVFEAPIVANPDPGVNDANNGDWSGVSDWSSQMFIEFNEALEEGTEIRVSFDYYCSDERTINTQAHGAPGAYHHWAFLGDLQAKPEWQKKEWEGAISAEQAGSDGCKAIAFNLSTAKPEATFYINNVVVEKKAADAVQTIAPVQVKMTGVYNLNGVKVADELNSNLPKGIYIVNGKKVVR